MQPGIRQQLELERRMVDLGTSRYYNAVSRAVEDSRAADTGYAQQLMQEFIKPVSDKIKDFCAPTKGAGVKAKYKTLIRKVDPDKAAYLTLRAIFNHFTKEENLATVAINIGTLIEDEIKFQRFHSEHKEYFETIIKDFARKGTKGYRHMHRVLTMKSKEKDVQWSSWSTQDKAAVGVKMIDFVMEATDLIEKGTKPKKRGQRLQTTIRASADCVEWIRTYQGSASLLNPDRMPCIVEPDDWVDMNQGGYFSPHMRSKTQLVKTRSPAHRRILETSNLTRVCRAVNTLQRVPWKVNTDVLDVLRDVWRQSLPIGLPQSEPYTIPPVNLPDIKKADMTEEQLKVLLDWKTEARIVHTMERDRVSKCFQVARVLRLANEFKDYDRFWYVYQCDFRGRIYATVSGMSPQGADYAKALLHFAEGKPITKAGVRWLQIHGANCFGEDKLPYDGRVLWVQQHEQDILQVAADPIEARSLWMDADKPWQYLAFCLEYARFVKSGRDTNMVSHLPIGLDGSCNGLQNFSAMFRDAVGGKATNLTPAEKPADIYSEVAAKCTELLKKLCLERSAEDPCHKWLEFAVSGKGNILPRGLAKKPVMTLPYGSTQQSCRESIYKYLCEEAPAAFDKRDRFIMSVYLTPILWDAIGQVVIAARAGMDWVQSCAGVLAKAGKPVYWITPVGFPVYQDRKRTVIKQIHTELSGHFRMRVAVDTEKLDVGRQRLGASPNFVHSLDACHLMMTLESGEDMGIKSFACIHDDFGTHAADTDMFHTAIRKAFIKMYTHNDPVQEFKNHNETYSKLELPAFPPLGELPIERVIDSKYFFG